MSSMSDLSVLRGQRKEDIPNMVNKLAHGSGRTRVINLNSSHSLSDPALEHWEHVRLESNESQKICETISSEDIVICLDGLDRSPDPSGHLDFFASAYRRGALILTTMRPQETDDHQIFERIIPEYRSLLTTAGLPSLIVGLNGDFPDDGRPCLVSIHEPRLQRCFRRSVARPLAVISCYNEADVIEEVIQHWVSEGCCLHVLDNWSTDQTWPLLLAAAERYGDLITIERFPSCEPASGGWEDILRRKEEIAEGHRGRWIIHTDADEIRCSPLLSFKLADAFAMVETAGWNRVDFTVLNHRPVDDRPIGPGGLVAGLPYFEFGRKPGHFVQKKAWIQGRARVNLAGSGGHLAEFEGAQDCPYRFVLHHYPLRSPEHARRKINHERAGRWSIGETARGWHSHYNEFIGSERILWYADQLHDSREHFWERYGLRILLGPNGLDCAGA